MNPDAQAKVEVVAKSYVPETAIPLGINAAEQAQRDEAKELRLRYEATKATDPYAALKTPEELSELSSIDVEREIGRRILAPETGLTDLRPDAERAAKEAKIIAEQGIDGITEPGRQDVIIANYVTNVLNLREGFKGLFPDEKEAIARLELGRKEVRIIIAALLKERLGPEADPETDEDRILATKKREREAKQAESTNLATEIDDIAAQLRVLQETLDKYNPEDKSAGTPAGQLFNEMALAEAGINSAREAQLRIELTTFYGKDKVRLELARQSIRQREQDGKTITDPKELEVKELMRLEDAQAEYDRMKEEKKNLPKEIANLNAEMAKRTQRQQAVIIESALLDSEINPLIQKRRAREMNTVAVIERIITQAGNRALNKDVDDRAKLHKELITEKAKTAENEDDKILYEALGSRWDEVVTAADGKSTIESKPDIIKKDWEDAMASGGDILAQVELLFTEQITRNITAFSTTEQREKADAEVVRIRKRLNTDPDFAAHATSEYLVNLITRRLDNGEEISVEDQSIMERYNWMQHVETSVNQSAQNDEDLKTQIDAILDKAGMADQERFQALQEQYPKNWAKILALFFSGAEIPQEGSFDLLGFIKRLRG